VNKGDQSKIRDAVKETIKIQIFKDPNKDTDINLESKDIYDEYRFYNEPDIINLDKRPQSKEEKYQPLEYQKSKNLTKTKAIIPNEKSQRTASEEKTNTKPRTTQQSSTFPQNNTEYTHSIKEYLKFLNNPWLPPCALTVISISAPFFIARSLLNPFQGIREVHYDTINTPNNLNIDPEASYEIPFSNININELPELTAGTPVSQIPMISNSDNSIDGETLKSLYSELQNLSTDLTNTQILGGLEKMETLQPINGNTQILTNTQKKWLKHSLNIQNTNSVAPDIPNSIDNQTSCTGSTTAEQQNEWFKASSAEKGGFISDTGESSLFTGCTETNISLNPDVYNEELGNFMDTGQSSYEKLGKIVRALGLEKDLPNLVHDPNLPEAEQLRQTAQAFLKWSKPEDQDWSPWLSEDGTGKSLGILGKRIQEIINYKDYNQATVLPGSNAKEVLIASGVSDIPTDYGIINHTDSVQGANNIADNIKQYASNAWQAVSGTVEDITKFTTQSLEKVQDFLGEEVCQAIGENLPAISCAVSAGLSAYQAHQACKNNDSEKKSFGKEFVKYFCPNGKVLKAAEFATLLVPTAHLALKATTSIPKMAAKASTWRASHLIKAAKEAENKGYVFKARELEAAANLNQEAADRFEEFNQGVSNFGDQADEVVGRMFKKAKQTTSKAMASIGNKLQSTGKELVTLLTGNNWRNEL
jgi:hypothetical protein